MKLQIIVGSTREGRVSDRIAAWVATEARSMSGVDVDILDLRDYPMPFFDEAISPQYNPDRKLNPAVKKWLDKVAEGDAYVLVTPEYNRSTSAVLKNALDYLDFQFARKPVALVGHGSAGGAQAVAQLRGILPGVLAVSVPPATFFLGRAAEAIDETGEMQEELKQNPYGPHAALKRMLEETKWYSDALAAARK